MKKLLAMLLVAALLVVSCAALAEVPEGYPEIIEGLDFGGQTVYFYDWWSNGERVEDPDDELANTYAYRDWLEETYNVKLVEKALSDWQGNPTELANRVMNKDNSELCLIAVASDFAGNALANNLYMPWSIDLSSDKWNAIASQFTTLGGNVYGVNVGANEPRSCIFFNKRVLEEAGVDYNTIYDAQADGTWTWDMMTEIMAKVQRDVDNDGVIDVYGMTGSGDDFTIGLVISNGANFFDTVDGKLAPVMGSDAALEALQFRIDTWNTYAAPQPADTQWDWFKSYWKEGTTAFYAGQTWQGFNDGSEMADMADEWGAVMFPKGPKGADYMAMACPNIYGIPNVYDEETSLKLQQIYDLYTYDVNGGEENETWVGNKILYTDERAVYETYAMMRGNDHACAYKLFLLGSNNDVIGSNLLWALGNGTPAEIVEAGMPAWQSLCDIFNGN